MSGSLTVYDDEAQEAAKRGELITEINRWGPSLHAYAVSKGLPPNAEFYTRRNSSGTGTIFEWDNA